MLQPGKGWIAANVQADSDKPFAAIVEAGGKISPNWAAFGDAWIQPTIGQFGGDVGARFKGNLDIFAGGSADLNGNYQAQAGLKLNF